MLSCLPWIPNSSWLLKPFRGSLHPNCAEAFCAHHWFHLCFIGAATVKVTLTYYSAIILTLHHCVASFTRNAFFIVKLSRNFYSPWSMSPSLLGMSQQSQIYVGVGMGHLSVPHAHTDRYTLCSVAYDQKVPLALHWAHLLRSGLMLGWPSQSFIAKHQL